MSDIALSVRGLTKEYQILHNAERHDRVTDAVANSVKSVFRKKEIETFRALDDVSFDVKKGEVLGVIGRNGAGKSTLLKILSRITEPTSGEVHLFGRVGSLLEVGTGFHPELTGRENIFLNGAILGMRKREIERQFDAIVDFAEVEKFLDTPVKRYSSGMYVRLAFAVAAHLNPEILIVDEVLAVGDAQFQKKCLGKMRDVSREEGRTVLFVSHNVAAIQKLCSRACLLSYGRLDMLSSASQVVSAYMQIGLHSHTESLANRKDRIGTGVARVTGIRVTTIRGQEVDSISPMSPFVFEIDVELRATVENLMLSIDVDTPEGTRLTTLWTGFRGQSFSLNPGQHRMRCTIRHLDIRPDIYSIGVGLGDSVQTYDLLSQAMSLVVVATKPVEGYENMMPRHDHGALLSSFSWAMEAEYAKSVGQE